MFETVAILGYKKEKTGIGKQSSVLKPKDVFRSLLKQLCASFISDDQDYTPHILYTSTVHAQLGWLFLSFLEFTRTTSTYVDSGSFIMCGVLHNFFNGPLRTLKRGHDNIRFNLALSENFGNSNSRLLTDINILDLYYRLGYE